MNARPGPPGPLTLRHLHLSEASRERSEPSRCEEVHMSAPISALVQACHPDSTTSCRSIRHRHDLLQSEGTATANSFSPGAQARASRRLQTVSSCTRAGSLEISDKTCSGDSTLKCLCHQSVGRKCTQNLLKGHGPFKSSPVLNCMHGAVRQ